MDNNYLKFEDDNSPRTTHRHNNNSEVRNNLNIYQKIIASEFNTPRTQNGTASLNGECTDASLIDTNSDDNRSHTRSMTED